MVIVFSRFSVQIRNQIANLDRFPYSRLPSVYLEAPDEREFAENDTRHFIEQNPDGWMDVCIMDEAQGSPGNEVSWLDALRAGY